MDVSSSACGDHFGQRLSIGAAFKISSYGNHTGRIVVQGTKSSIRKAMYKTDQSSHEKIACSNLDNEIGHSRDTPIVR